MLAIIIPAYKSIFLKKALDSLANQTNKNFNLYIGDDCSPDNILEIVNEYSDKLKIIYVRFENNIGAERLVEQWKRCVDLTQNEKWLWLFSDDDIADENCVENFYRELDKNNDKVDVYRFNTVVIDKEGIIKVHTPISPYYESSVEMAYNLLLGNRGNSMPDHIFSKKIFEESGGFVFTYYAQAADWATSILFSDGKGIITIPDAKLFWRLSESNISSEAALKKRKMLKGYLQFITWLVKHFQNLDQKETSITQDMIFYAATQNLEKVIRNHYRGISPNDYYSVIRVMHKSLKISYSDAVIKILRILVDTNFIFHSIFIKLNTIKKNIRA